MNVPQVDLARSCRPIETEILRAISDVLHSQQMILGPAVERFEKSLAAQLGSGFAVGCASGSDALLLALEALGIGEGDEVVTTPFTFFATVGAIVRSGARPVFADIDPATFNIDPVNVAAAMTPRTKAVIPVHLYGLSADMDPILESARRRGAAVIEDAAQSIGARYRGKHCGAIGTVGCFSFYPSKNLGAAGDAGALLTDDERLATELRSLRVHGSMPGRSYEHRAVGFNSRLDAVQAAVLSVKFPHLDAWTAERRKIARAYDEGLAAIQGVVRPTVPEGCDHVWYQYVIRAERRDALKSFLADAGVETRVFYPKPMHLQDCFSGDGGLGLGEGDFPESERAANEVLALPIFPGLLEPEIVHVVSSIRRFYNGGGRR